jgi:hypothetical protein
VRVVLRRPAAGFGAAALLLGASGCFVYVPGDAASVPAGESVRVRLTRAAGTELRELTTDEPSVVRGTVLRREPERLLLRVPLAARRDGFAMQPIAQDVGIATADIVDLELRRKSAGRTALLAAGTGAVGLVVIGMILGGARDPVLDAPEPPNELRVPIR